MYSGYLVQILDLFGQNPAQARKALRTMWEQAAPDHFRASIVPVLAQTPEGPAQRFLVSFLLQHTRLEQSLADHQAFTREEAVELARAAQRVDPSLDVKLAMQLAAHSAPVEHDARRILEILDAISAPGNLLPMLGAIVQHPDPRVRSKAALLMGKGNRNPGWVRQQLSEPDVRVRANAVESLWGMDSAEACEVFRDAAFDTHQRTAVNGMLGLYLCGRTESVKLLAEAAERDNAAFRASAAWGMGKTQDSRFLQLLARLVRDRDATVRSNALKAISRIRSYRTLMQRQPKLDLILEGPPRASGRQRELAGIVRDAAGGLPPVLSPIHFAVEEDGQPGLTYQVEILTRTEASVGIVLPSGCGDEAADRSLESAWSELVHLKPAGQPWSLACYTNAATSRPPAEPAFTNSTDSLAALRRAFHKGPYEGFVAAMNGILYQMPLRGERVLVVAGSPMAEHSPIVTARQSQMERVVRECTASSVRVTAVAPPLCAPIMRVALNHAAEATGGRYLESESWEDFARLIAHAARVAFPTFRMRYDAVTASAPTSVRLMVASPAGCGECTVTPPRPLH